MVARSTTEIFGFIFALQAGMLVVVGIMKNFEPRFAIGCKTRPVYRIKRRLGYDLDMITRRRTSETPTTVTIAEGAYTRQPRTPDESPDTDEHSRAGKT
jgi:hypothetical protein